MGPLQADFMRTLQTDVARTMLRAAWWIVPAWAVLSLTYALPQCRLDGLLATYAVAISATATLWGIPFAAVVATGLLVSRPGMTVVGRVIESTVVLGVLLVAMGGGAYVNEHVVKPRLAVPRPNVMMLADTGALGMTADEFYSLPDKATRSRRLAAILDPPTCDALRLSDSVRRHWIEETGFSFPSGHSFASMVFATYLILLAVGRLRSPNRHAFYLLAPWAALVCVSRVVLRVHSPTDVLCGGLIGMMVGAAAFALVQAILTPAGIGRPGRDPQSNSARSGSMHRGSS